MALLLGEDTIARNRAAVKHFSGRVIFSLLYPSPAYFFIKVCTKNKPYGGIALKHDEMTKSVSQAGSVVALLKGILIAYCITAAVFLAYSLLITYTSLGENYMSIVTAATTIVAVIVAGFDAARGARSRGWLWGIAAGAVYALILLLIMMTVQKGVNFDSRTVTIMVLALSGGGLGGVIGINLRK